MIAVIIALVLNAVWKTGIPCLKLPILAQVCLHMHRHGHRHTYSVFHVAHTVQFVEWEGEEMKLLLPSRLADLPFQGSVL